MKTKKQLNEPLTVEKLKTYKGLENVTQEEAYEIIASLKQLAALTFRYYNHIKTNKNEE